MPQSNVQTENPGLSNMKIEDFGELQLRYQPLAPGARATAVLADAHVALQVAERVLTKLSERSDCKQFFDKIRKNSMLIGKLRPSDARVALMDSSCDFIKETLRKLGAWRKTLERLAAGEGIAKDKGNKEYIRSDDPISLSVAGSTGISNYISIVQLVLMDVSKAEKNAPEYATMTAEIRRCATVLSDYENAASFMSLVR
jgi:hypothetical protein